VKSQPIDQFIVGEGGGDFPREYVIHAHAPAFVAEVVVGPPGVEKPYFFGLGENQEDEAINLVFRHFLHEGDSATPQIELVALLEDAASAWHTYDRQLKDFMEDDEE